MELARLFVKIDGDISGLQKKIGAVERALSALGKRAEAAGKTLTAGLTVPLAGLGGLAVRSATDLDSLRRGLTAVAGSAAEAERQLGRLSVVARLPGLGFREAIEGSIRLQAAGFSASLAEDALRGFGNALATVGGGKTELDQVTRALSQIASKGKISAEEINQLAEVVPQIRVVMQEAFGTSNSELLQNAGIDAQTFVRRVTDELLKLKQVSDGPATAFENLSDAWFRASAAIGERLLPAVLPLIEGLATTLEKLRGLNPETVKWGIALAGVAAGAGPLLYLTGVILKLSAAIKGFLALKTAATIAAMTTGVGLAVVALGGLAAVFVKNKLDALEAASAADKYAQSLRNLTRAQAQVGVFKLADRTKEIQEELARTPEFIHPAVLSSNGKVIARSRRRVANPRYAQLLAEQDAITRQSIVLAEHLAELREDEAGESGGPAGGGLNGRNEALKAMGERVRTLVGLYDSLRARGEGVADVNRAIEAETKNVLQALRAQGGALNENRLELEKMLDTLRSVGGIRELGDRVSLLVGLQEALRARGESTAEVNREIELVTGVVLQNLQAQGNAVTETRLELQKMLAVLQEAAAIRIDPKIAVPYIRPRSDQDYDAATGRFISRPLSERARASMDLTPREVASRPSRIPLGLRARVTVDRAGGAIGGAAEGALNGLASAGMKLLNVFNPLSMISTVFGKALESLAPAFEPLVNVVGRVGGIFAKALAPVLEALWPVFKITAIAATFLGQALLKGAAIFADVIGFVVKGWGHILKALATAVDKLPFVSAKGAIKFAQGIIDTGNAIQDMADGFREGARGLGEARKEIEGLTWEDATKPLHDAARDVAREFYNISEAFDPNRTRYDVARAGGTIRPPSTPTHLEIGPTNVTIQTAAGEDPVRFWERLKEVIRRERALGGTTELDLAVLGVN